MEMEHAKHFGDAGALMMTIATVAGWLPAIAALVSIVWTCIRIFETKTVQRWVKGWE